MAGLRIGMPCTSRVVLLAPLLGLLGCTDYGVSHSELSDEIESEDVTLAAGGSAEILLRLQADEAALAPKPNNWVDITVFALRKSLSPIVSASAGSDSIQMPVVNIEYLDLTVDDPMGNCWDPEGGGAEATLLGDGSCEVIVPVMLAVADGEATLQITAHYELSFGSKQAPGEMSISIE